MKDSTEGEPEQPAGRSTRIRQRAGALWAWLDGPEWPPDREPGAAPVEAATAAPAAPARIALDALPVIPPMGDMPVPAPAVAPMPRVFAPVDREADPAPASDAVAERVTKVGLRSRLQAMGAARLTPIAEAMAAVYALTRDEEEPDVEVAPEPTKAVAAVEHVGSPTADAPPVVDLPQPALEPEVSETTSKSVADLASEPAIAETDLPEPSHREELVEVETEPVLSEPVSALPDLGSLLEEPAAEEIGMPELAQPEPIQREPIHAEPTHAEPLQVEPVHAERLQPEQAKPERLREPAAQFRSEAQSPFGPAPRRAYAPPVAPRRSPRSPTVRSYEELTRRFLRLEAMPRPQSAPQYRAPQAPTKQHEPVAQTAAPVSPFGPSRLDPQLRSDSRAQTFDTNVEAVVPPSVYVAESLASPDLLPTPMMESLAAEFQPGAASPVEIAASEPPKAATPGPFPEEIDESWPVLAVIAPSVEPPTVSPAESEISVEHVAGALAVSTQTTPALVATEPTEKTETPAPPEFAKEPQQPYVEPPVAKEAVEAPVVVAEAVIVEPLVTVAPEPLEIAAEPIAANLPLTRPITATPPVRPVQAEIAEPAPRPVAPPRPTPIKAEVVTETIGGFRPVFALAKARLMEEDPNFLPPAHLRRVLAEPDPLPAPPAAPVPPVEAEQASIPTPVATPVPEYSIESAVSEAFAPGVPAAELPAPPPVVVDPAVDLAAEVAARAAEAARRESQIRQAVQREVERLAAERLAAHQERVEAERAEAARITAERDAARRATELLEAAQREMAARVEAERQAALLREATRREEEARAEAQREAERLAASRRELERLEAERLAAEQLVAERLHAELIDAEAQAIARREAAELETELRERARRDAERREAARMSAEQLQQQRLRDDEEFARREAALAEAEQREAELLAALPPVRLKPSERMRKMTAERLHTQTGPAIGKLTVEPTPISRRRF